MMRIFMIFCGLYLFSSCANRHMEAVDFLIGTWKIDSKDQFESWEKESNNELIGYSYKVNENQKIFWKQSQ
jgi:hypothetical protein